MSERLRASRLPAAPRFTQRGGAAAKAECARSRAQQRRRAHDGANHRDSACARTLLRPGRPSKRLSLSAIEKHWLRIGTAYSFQGDERDIMFLSFAIGREAHPGTLRYLDRPDVFNVSITTTRFCFPSEGGPSINPPKSHKHMQTRLMEDRT